MANYEIGYGNPACKATARRFPRFGQIFVGVLGASNLTYAEATRTQ